MTQMSGKPLLVTIGVLTGSSTLLFVRRSNVVEMGRGFKFE
jgi:hypothetical protein